MRAAACPPLLHARVCCMLAACTAAAGSTLPAVRQPQPCSLQAAQPALGGGLVVCSNHSAGGEGTIRSRTRRIVCVCA